MAHSEDFIKLVTQAKMKIKEIDSVELLKKMTSKSSFFLIDVREDNEWKMGHLPNAIHISKGVLERDILSYLSNKEEEVILYCGGGYRSALAADNLQKMGFTKVFSLKGGISEWADLNFPLEI